jgi:hypothetical protein
MEKHRLRVSENRMLRIYGPKRRQDGGNCIMKSFTVCTLSLHILG